MLNSLQILRGLAAWTVVIHHIIQSYFMGDTKNSVIFMIIHKYGSIGVDIFFILSGVVMGIVAAKYMKSGVTFGINRVIRVVPVYWFYTLILVLSILLFPTGTYLTWWEGNSLLKSILFIPNINPNGYGYFPTLYVGWTLIYEMFFYLLFTLILILRVPYPTITCAFTLIVIAILTRNNNFLGQSSLLLIEFSIGITIALLLKTRFFKEKNTLAIVVLLSLFLLALFFKYLEWNIFSKMLLAGAVVWGGILLEKYFCFNNKITLFLKKLGDFSYSTYLSHVIVIGWFFHFFASGKNAINDSIAFTGIIITVYFISMLSYHYVESNQYIEALKRKLATKSINKTKQT